MPMTLIALYTIAGLFALMGMSSIFAPTVTTRQFGINDLDRDGRNEVRAVYGGFGLAMSGVLIAAALIPAIRTGISLTVGMAIVSLTNPSG